MRLSLINVPHLSCDFLRAVYSTIFPSIALLKLLLKNKFRAAIRNRSKSLWQNIGVTAFQRPEISEVVLEIGGQFYF